MDTNEETIRRIYEDWHDAVVQRDLKKLTELYVEKAVFESPLVWAVHKESGSGILHGRTAIWEFFAAGFRTPANGLGRWSRTGTFFSNGRQLVWEYPREPPEGDQIDLIEVMDVTEGHITRHAVYWGWVGFKTLSAL